MENVSPKADFLFLGDQTYFKAKLNVPVYYHAKVSFRHLYTSPRTQEFTQNEFPAAGHLDGAVG